MVTKRDYNTSRNVNFNTDILKPIQEMLSGRIFSGWIGERKWIEKLNNYRDIIEIDEWENSINAHLNSLIVGVDGANNGECWINITGPSSSTPCYSIWVLLAELVPVGHYWFKVEDVLFDSKFGLNLVITQIREVSHFDGETFDERCRRQRTIDEIDPVVVWKEFFANLKFENFKGIGNFMLTSFSPANIVAVFRLVVILFIACLAACKEISLYLLKIIHELGILVQRSTPLFETLLNCFTKIIGGMLLFLTMIYNDLRRPKRRVPPPPQNEGSQGRQPEQSQAIRYIAQDRWQTQHQNL